MVKANKKSREEKLAQARLHKKKKYEEIKNDPERYALQKEKERERYIRRKEQKKIKTINELTPRQQRQQRKKWRENRKNYVEKKKRAKAIEQILLDNSPPTSDEEVMNEVNPLEGPSSSLANYNKNNDLSINKCKTCIQKDRQIRRIRYAYSKRINQLRKELEKEKKDNFAVKKALHRNIRNSNKSQKETPSTEVKIEALIDNIDSTKKEEVKKKLMFGEIISKQLQEGFKSLKKKEKRQFTDVVVVKKEKFKKHKLLKAINSFTVRDKKEVNKKIERDIKQDIESFFDDDSNSRISADKKEYIKRNNITKQKRYLSDTLVNLHNKYNKTHKKVGYSTFCKNRPFWVIYPKESNRNTCSCLIHTNMDLLIKTLQKNKIIKECNGTALLESLCCDIRNEECLNRTCITCNRKVIQYGEFRNDTHLKYFQWETKIVKYCVKNEERASKKTTKSEKEDMPLNLVTKLEDSLPRYFKHCLTIVKQYNNINTLKMTLTPNEVLIHMDFSENYISKFHEEVQSHHFGSSPEQISLHTSVAYLLDSETGLYKTYSMCTMSDCTRHDAESVWAHIIPIIEFVKTKSFIDTLHFLTDSPTSQYRNRKIFYIMSQLQHMFPDLKTVTWNYLESGHGKGAPDGIGAVLKRTADKTVRFGKDVGSLKDFWLVMKEKLKNIEICLVTQKDIEERKTPQKLNSFKGTMSVHQVLWSSNSLRLTFRKLSCFVCPNGVDCAHGYHLGYIDAPENNIQQEQEQLLNDFLEINATSEILEEITNSPKKKLPLLEDVTRSPKVKILSDIRLDWSNTSFYKKTQNLKQQNCDFQTDFEKFISSSTLKTSSGEPSKILKNYDIFKAEKNLELKDKENILESDDDEDYNIF